MGSELNTPQKREIDPVISLVVPLMLASLQKPKEHGSKVKGGNIYKFLKQTQFPWLG